MIAEYRGRNLFKTSGRCAISAKKLGILLNFCVRASNVACAAGAALSFVSGLTAAMEPAGVKRWFLGWVEGVYTRWLCCGRRDSLCAVFLRPRLRWPLPA